MITPMYLSVHENSLRKPRFEKIYFEAYNIESGTHTKEGIFYFF